MALKDRIRLLIKWSGLTQKEFAKKCNLSTPLITQWLSGVNKQFGSSINKIKAAYPEIDLNWLVSGEGEFEIKKETEPKSLSLEEKYSMIQTENIILKEQIATLKDFLKDKERTINIVLSRRNKRKIQQEA